MLENFAKDWIRRMQICSTKDGSRSELFIMMSSLFCKISKLVLNRGLPCIVNNRIWWIHHLNSTMFFLYSSHCCLLETNKQKKIRDDFQSQKHVHSRSFPRSENRVLSTIFLLSTSNIHMYWNENAFGTVVSPCSLCCSINSNIDDDERIPRAVCRNYGLTWIPSFCVSGIAGVRHMDLGLWLQAKANCSRRLLANRGQRV